MNWSITNATFPQAGKSLEPERYDSIVTDPPYGLGFMGKDWDHGVPGVQFWTEFIRAAKPGAHLLAFGGTRTFHRLACAIEDAGFEIRDCIMWVYGSGFPKSLDVSKAIDKAAGAEREVVGINEDYLRRKPNGMKTAGATAYGYSQSQQETDARITAPATDAARQWDGWGTALKPAWEPIIVARKPLAGTVAANCLEHGTGGLNIDGCRVPHTDEVDLTAKQRQQHDNRWGGMARSLMNAGEIPTYKPGGRWPANLIHDGSPDVVDLFPFVECGAMARDVEGFESESNTGFLNGRSWPGNQYGGDGTAARFFYCAKADASDRSENGAVDNRHPTVKPFALMKYLVRLVTPPGGLILDPFCGSGSTGKAALAERFSFDGFDQDAESCRVARERLAIADRDARSCLF